MYQAVPLVDDNELPLAQGLPIGGGVKMFKGILGDPKTTLIGVLVILVTVGFLLGKLSMEAWIAAVGFIAGGRWLLENKTAA